MKKILKKILVMSTVIGVIMGGLLTIPEISHSVYAKTDAGGGTGVSTGGSTGGSSTGGSTGGSASFSGRKGNACKAGFVGFISWDCNVNISDQTSLKNGIWQIVANVATDIAVAATYLMIGYTIYGGYLYIFSGGDPGKTAAGKQTLARAFIGLAITSSANLIMGTLRAVLFNGKNITSQCLEAGGCVKPATIMTGTINWFIGVSGVVAAIFVVYGGILYMTSGGDPNKTQKAKNMIMYALIGLAIVALSSVISGFVSNMIEGANNAMLINNTIIAKELL
ncbi:hypothetical protein IKG16_00960 [Candidatus Saccharibacteria bacterium]|nr:hypothetical protein [Candidatus Saccharibacteria bacterium]